MDRRTREMTVEIERRDYADRRTQTRNILSYAQWACYMEALDEAYSGKSGRANGDIAADMLKKIRKLEEAKNG